MKKLIILLLIMFPLPVACTGSDSAQRGAFCASTDLPFPRKEPDYSGKLDLDFTPFATVLRAYTPADANARETLVSGKTIPELQTLMENGDLTSEDLVIYYLERIKRYDVEKLNSVLELNPEALVIAQSLDVERKAGRVRGPLHGIPVLIKDNIATGDEMHTAAGAAVLLRWDPDRDAFLVDQLRKAGAVVLGKSNLSEWANYMDPCMPNGFSTNGGQTRNPYGPFETFGSSSGSAVSVAADLATVSVGTETQGSIIRPAGINSVVGLKPTKGLISTDYIVPLLPSQDTPGPIGRSVTDAAILLSAMTGEDKHDLATSTTKTLAGVDYTQFLTIEAVENLKIGLPVWNDQAFEEYFANLNVTDAKTQEDLRAAFAPQNDTVRAQGEILSAAGVTVVEIPITAIPQTVDVNPLLEYGYKDSINSFLASLGGDAPVRTLEGIISFNEEDLADRAPYGQGYLVASQNTKITANEFIQMQQDHNSFAKASIDSLLAEYNIDIVVSDLGQLYAPAGYPALTVPSGYGEDGQPRAVVFVGSFMSEPQLLAVGYAYEQSTQGRKAPDLEAAKALIEAIK